MLEGGDRTIGVREGGLQMGENVRCRGPACRFRRCLRRRLGRRTPSEQSRANRALAAIESLPEALHGSVAEMAAGGADRGGDACGRGPFEERPQPAARQTQSPDFVREPNAERATATRACMAVAAKDPSGAHRSSPRILFVEPVQVAMPNQRAHHLAAGTRHLLKPLGDRDPFAFVAIKPTLPTHLPPTPPKIADFTGATKSGGRGGVREKSKECGERDIHREQTLQPRRPFCQILGVTTTPPLGRQFGKITLKSAIRARERTLRNGHPARRSGCSPAEPYPPPGQSQRSTAANADSKGSGAFFAFGTIAEG